MDTLFVEEMAASLVREFLNRKVNTSPSPEPTWGSSRGGQPGGSLAPLGRAHCWPAACFRYAPTRAPFSRVGETTFPRSHFCCGHLAFQPSRAGSPCPLPFPGIHSQGVGSNCVGRGVPRQSQLPMHSRPEPGCLSPWPDTPKTCPTRKELPTAEPQGLRKVLYSQTFLPF